MENSEFLWRLISVIVFVLPIAGLIWKAAVQSARIKDMAEKLRRLEQQVIENEKNSKSDISEIKQSINQINISNAEILTSLSFIKEALSKKEGKQ